MSVCRYVGMSVCRYVGMSVCRYVGMLVCQYHCIIVSVYRCRCHHIQPISVSSSSNVDNLANPCLYDGMTGLYDTDGLTAFYDGSL